VFNQVLDVKSQLQFPEDRSKVLQSFKDRYNSYWVGFDVTVEGDYFSLKNGDQRVARLNKKTCNDLLPLKEDIIIRAFANTQKWSETWKELPSQVKVFPFSVELNIYGLKEDANRIGELLSSSGTFLQPPQFETEDFEYHNPHFFRFDGYIEKTALHPLLSEEPGFSSGHSKRIDASEAEILETQTSNAVQVDSILDSLSHHSDLRQISIDRRIKTELLEYAELENIHSQFLTGYFIDTKKKL
jgi:SWI/SNF-related matrix-associated actin-dependent regulator of chromatin subfamily A3